MFKFFPYILKNLRGHRVRTVMTTGGTALLMFLFCFVSSVQEGLNRLLDSRDDRLIVYQAYRFCPSTSQLPGLYKDKIKAIPGVKEVLPVKVKVTNCRASLDTVVFNGVEPQTLQRVRKFTFLQGDWNAFLSRQDAALVGRKIAERRGLKAGQGFAVAGVQVVVAGVFGSELPGEENVIYTHLTLLQPFKEHHKGSKLRDESVTLYEVHPQDPERAGELAAEIDRKINGAPIDQVNIETKPQKAHFLRALSDLVDLIGFTRWLGFVCVGVVIVLVANSVIMAAQDRIKEHAVLQTIGFSGRRIFSLMLTESLIISLAGGIVGTVGAIVWLAQSPIAVSTEGVSIDFLATPTLAMWGLGLSLLVGLVAGLVPAWQAGRSEIVTSLR